MLALLQYEHFFFREGRPIFNVKTKIRMLSFADPHQNKFTGVVPEWLGELSRLRGLVMGENRLRGHIPWQLGHLHKVKG